LRARHWASGSRATSPDDWRPTNVDPISATWYVAAVRTPVGCARTTPTSLGTPSTKRCAVGPGIPCPHRNEPHEGEPPATAPDSRRRLIAIRVRSTSSYRNFSRRLGCALGLTLHPSTAGTVAVEAPPPLSQFLSHTVELLARRRFITAAADRFKGIPFPNQAGGARWLASRLHRSFRRRLRRRTGKEKVVLSRRDFRVVQDDLIRGYCAGQSASRDPSELRTRRDRASRRQPRLASPKAEEAAATRNSDFEECRGNQAAESGA
jgi:hypothetical protein